MKETILMSGKIIRDHVTPARRRSHEIHGHEKNNKCYGAQLICILRRRDKNSLSLLLNID